MRRDPCARGKAGTSVAAPARVGAAGGVAHTLTAHHGRNSGEDVYALGFHATQDPISSIERAPAISAESTGSAAVFAFDQAQITSKTNRATVSPFAPVPTVSAESRMTIAGGLRPRRLTPREVERCFGFPDDYTLVNDADDSPRYEALGNSMAVPVMAWIGRRLLTVDGIMAAQRKTEAA